MTPKEFSNLEGKLRRTVYAIIFQDLVVKIDTLDKKQLNVLLDGIDSAMDSAVEDAIEYMVDNGIIDTGTRKRKKRK